MSTAKKQFDLHTRLFNNVIQGITDADANAQANEQVNHLKWLAGHLTTARFNFKDLAQLEMENPLADLFSHGKPMDPEADYPSMESIQECWNQISSSISNALGNLSEDVLQADAPQVPLGEGKMGDFIDFLMHHEAYHLGQMGLLRKFLGKDAMSYA